MVTILSNINILASVYRKVRIRMNELGFFTQHKLNLFSVIQPKHETLLFYVSFHNRFS